MIIHPYVKRLTEQTDNYLGAGDILWCGVSLRRNFSSMPFPNVATVTELAAVREITENIFAKEDIKTLVPEFFAVPYKEMTDADKAVLTERGLLAPYHNMFSPEAYLLCAVDGSLSVTINGMDHLEFRTQSGSESLETLYGLLEELENAIGMHVRYMYNERYGYLTAAAKNAGTGLRCHYLLHLPVLTLMDEFGKRASVMNMLGFRCEAAYAEKGSQHGNLYILVNETTMGEREEDVIARLEVGKNWLIREEKDLLRSVLMSQPLLLLNPCSRAYGLLKYTRMLTKEETLDGLTMLQVGVDSGFLKEINNEDIRRYRKETTSGWIKAKENKEFTNLELASYRGDYIRKELSGPDYTIKYRD